MCLRKFPPSPTLLLPPPWSQWSAYCLDPVKYSTYTSRLHQSHPCTSVVSWVSSSGFQAWGNFSFLTASNEALWFSEGMATWVTVVVFTRWRWNPAKILQWVLEMFDSLEHWFQFVAWRPSLVGQVQLYGSEQQQWSVSDSGCVAKSHSLTHGADPFLRSC
jgi:hypothetical protein